MIPQAKKPDPYEMLGLSLTDNPYEINRAYEKKLAECASDPIAQLDAWGALASIAEARVKGEVATRPQPQIVWFTSETTSFSKKWWINNAISFILAFVVMVALCRLVW